MGIPSPENNNRIRTFITRSFYTHSIYNPSFLLSENSKNLAPQYFQLFSLFLKIHSKNKLDKKVTPVTPADNNQNEYLFPPDVTRSIAAQIYSSSLPVGLLVKGCSTILISGRLFKSDIFVNYGVSSRNVLS